MADFNEEMYKFMRTIIPYEMQKQMQDIYLQNRLKGYEKYFSGRKEADERSQRHALEQLRTNAFLKSLENQPYGELILAMITGQPEETIKMLPGGAKPQTMPISLTPGGPPTTMPVTTRATLPQEIPEQSRKALEAYINLMGGGDVPQNALVNMMRGLGTKTGTEAISSTRAVEEAAKDRAVREREAKIKEVRQVYDWEHMKNKISGAFEKIKDDPSARVDAISEIIDSFLKDKKADQEAIEDLITGETGEKLSPAELTPENRERYNKRKERIGKTENKIVKAREKLREELSKQLPEAVVKGIFEEEEEETERPLGGEIGEVIGKAGGRAEKLANDLKKLGYGKKDLLNNEDIINRIMSQGLSPEDLLRYFEE